MSKDNLASRIIIKYARTVRGTQNRTLAILWSKMPFSNAVTEGKSAAMPLNLNKAQF